MADEKNVTEEVAENQENVTTENVEKKEEVKTDNENKKEVVQEKKDIKLNLEQEDDVIKVDLREVNKKQEDAVQEQETTSVDVGEQAEVSEKVDAEVRPASEENNEKEEQVVELIQEDEKVEENENSLVDKIKDIPEKLKQEEEDVNIKQEINELPENIQKLVDFMKDTGGNIEDYVNLNKDFDAMDDMQILREYYRQNKPHLNDEEISFQMEDNFSVNEDEDDELTIKRKKIALKESIAEAKNSLLKNKDKYYEELKLSNKLNPEQREAVEFYNRYKAEQESSKKIADNQRSIFEKKTNDYFNEKFKGFEFKVGKNRYRYNVKNANDVRSNQSDINSLVSKFTNDKNEMQDVGGYHKALFTAMNSDAIANHFYEQGRADAIKEQLAKSKNIDMAPRGSHEEVQTTSGFKVRAISGDDSSKLRFKIKQ